MPAKVKAIPPGTKIGLWTVISEGGRSRLGAALWLCQCECGTTREVNGTKLRRGGLISCGLCQPRLGGPPKHGMSGTPLYRRWLSMIGRCTLPSQANYDRYGGRGISVCDRWRKFELFAEDMGESFKPGLTLDRIDGDGNYEPGNFRWATHKEQQRNTTRNRILTWSGRSLTVAEWAEELGINRNTIGVRIHRGWPVERVLGTPGRSQ